MKKQTDRKRRKKKISYKCHIRQNFFPYFSNSLFNFAQSILLARGRHFRPLDNQESTGRDKFLFGKLITFLYINLPSNSPSYKSLCFCLNDH